MNLPDSTKMNIIRVGALALVLLFFFAPLVRTTEFVSRQLASWWNIGEVSVTGWGFVTGEEIVFRDSWSGRIETIQVVDPAFLMIVLLILPLVLLALSWMKKSHEILATLALGGIVAKIIFIFWFNPSDSFQDLFRNEPIDLLDFTIFTWLVLALYIGISAFALYCVKEKGKEPKQAVIGVLKTAASSITNFAQSVNTPNAVCAGCGAGLDQGSMFCKSCGQKVTQPTPVATPTASTASAPPLKLTCTGCSASLEPGDKFCEGCGQKVAGGISPSTQQIVAPVSVAPSSATSTPIAASTYTSPPPPVRPMQQPQILPTPPIQPMANQPQMPLMFLLDTSASASPFVGQLTSCLNRFKSEVSQDIQAAGILDVSIIQFNDSPYVLQPYSRVADMKPVRLIAGGNPMYSLAIQEALRMAEDYTRTNNSYKPWIIFITNGGPADDISAVANKVQSLQQADKLRFMALGTQGYNASALKMLTDVVFRQDGDDFSSFFNWISKCMWAIAKTSPGEKPQLPTLEGNVYRDK